MANSSKKTILKTDKLSTYFPIREGVFSRVVSYVKAVQDVDIEIKQGEIFSLVGESGCGKSTLGNTILGLVEATSGKLSLGDSEFEFNNKKKPKYPKLLRRKYQMIFQNPNLALNPRVTVFQIIAEPMMAHKLCTKADAKEKVAYYLNKVGLSSDYMNRFPHTFSGGQKQRISIARAIALEPELIICDEITSALDVSVQAQILKLVLDLKDELDLSLVFISHDLSVVKNISDRIAVMYLGRIVEQGSVKQVLENPKHPYTKALLAAIPTLDKRKKPIVLQGDVPSPVNLPKGCYFASRCPNVQEICKKKYPQEQTEDGRSWSCFF